MTGLIETMAAAVLGRRALEARSLLQDVLRSGLDVSAYPRPTVIDPRIVTMTAALVDLLAMREGVSAPAWTDTVGELAEPFFVSKAALASPSMRKRHQRMSPPALRRRNVYAAASFLTLA
jgi:hypothetical protein